VILFFPSQFFQYVILECDIWLNHYLGTYYEN
jgi:hypothetical protein